MSELFFKKLIDARNAEEGFAGHLKIETTKVEEGCAEGKIEICPEHLNLHMTIHGGVLFSLADSVGGTAAMSFGKKVVTVNANIEYLRAGENVEVLYARAKSLDNGHRISRYYLEIEDQLKNLLAVGTFTYTQKNENVFND